MQNAMMTPWAPMRALARVSMLMVILMILVGCDAPAPEARLDKDQADASMREIQDMLGRQVSVPRDVERIATVNVDAFRMVVHLRADDRLVGIPGDMFGSRFSREKTIEALAVTGVEDIPQLGGGQPGSDINLERVVSVSPDVFFYWAFTRGDSTQAMADHADRLQRQLGVPVVAVSTLGRERDPKKIMAEIERAYALMGVILDREPRAEQLLDRYRQEVSSLQARIQGEAAPRVYLAHRTNLFSNVAFYYPLEQLGARNVASQRRGRDGEIAAEQLLQWDPEHIFLHTPSQASRVSLDTVLDDARLQDVAAIRDGQVHRFKGTYMGWDLATGLVDLIRMGRILYPQALEDLDAALLGEDILHTFYGKPGLYEHLARQSGFEDL
ncbi:ABC transporter substrate-binding protein [Ectothiorhodospira variabilis]|uniref:ABC transporter substrate-binding protein n=1 Tax=Ectothiorhodospira variabilis TaxID=505694 RepID=UPI001EFC06BC|nr:ABC transporter substrate-binding protein [Ectothiorhodospira variabilis]MCG5493966.1 ABC transporter substrate-binding protein [Ectothiorhodospira variabilis]MCG5498180.1 ABC transporter substrate-binding protein [Ectothiorhodospira variabilis]MCG5503769.1 ABC transporter substrate-binding protein [Ectothiorhodospira variabilis]MCG5506925.1 ABC transporter substrate-binding protein [Ectothiorhodospira variabilis]